MEPQDAAPLEDKAAAPASSPLSSSSPVPSGSGSGGGGVRRQRKYNRKTKRFVWPEELHHLFVATIFDMGLRQATPKALLALMEETAPGSGLTTEHLKSHLQKFRLNQQRTRAEFLEGYNRSKRDSKSRRTHRVSFNRDANTQNIFPHPSPDRNGSDSSDDRDNNDVPRRNSIQARRNQQHAAGLLISAAEAADARWMRPMAAHVSPLPYTSGGVPTFEWASRTHSPATALPGGGDPAFGMAQRPSVTATAARNEGPSSPDAFMAQEQVSYLDMQMRLAIQAQRSLYQQTLAREAPMPMASMVMPQETNYSRPMQWQQQASSEAPAPTSFTPDPSPVMEISLDAQSRLPPEEAAGFHSAATPTSTQQQLAMMPEQEDPDEKTMDSKSDDGSVDIARLSINLDDEDLFGFMEA